ncbi:MAG: hypothetical protein MJD61_11785 [Proteobacteria bacterium]|nr:hypothetical protein [Pseudomonadota bacterium]
MDLWIMASQHQRVRGTRGLCGRMGRAGRGRIDEAGRSWRWTAWRALITRMAAGLACGGRRSRFIPVPRGKPVSGRRGLAQRTRLAAPRTFSLRWRRLIWLMMSCTSS